MAQGPLKKAGAGRSKASSNPQKTKKGLRSIPPKRAGLVKQAGITKKHSAGLTAKTERGLAGKVGHLELLEGGKRSGKVGGAKKGGKGDKGNKKS